jgi:hypothetical protein
MGIVKRIHGWWLHGYGLDEDEINEVKSSSERKSLTEWLKDWWSRGYSYLDEDFDNGHDSLEQEDSTLEEDDSILEENGSILEGQSLSEKARGKPLETSKRDSLLMSNVPSREQLASLKVAMGIEKGSLHYKKMGNGIYQVTYDCTSKKYAWHLLGKWSELKDRIPQEASS